MTAGGGGWLALAGDALPHPGAAALRAGALVIALAGLPAEAGVVLDLPAGAVAAPRQGEFWQGDAPPPVALSVLAGRDFGVALRHRRGGQIARHMLPGPLAGGPAQLVFEWSAAGAAAPAGRWRLALHDGDGLLLAEVVGRDALALDPGAGWALCQPGGGRHAHAGLGAVGLRRAAPLAGAPEVLALGGAVSASAEVETPAGPRPLGLLRAGDRVIGLGGHATALAALHLFELPAGFGFSPLRLRAGRLPIGRDMLAGPQLQLAFAGEASAQLHGSARVLVAARHLPHPVQCALAPPPRRRVLMALPVPMRPLVLRLGGLPVACPGPDGRLPHGWSALSQAAAAALLAERGAAWQLAPAAPRSLRQS